MKRPLPMRAVTLLILLSLAAHCASQSSSWPVNVPAFFGLVLAEKTIKGCWYGSSDVRRDVPKLIDLYQKGELKLDELISRTIGIEQVNGRWYVASVAPAVAAGS